MRVFLTGGSGVLGRALVPALLAAGHEVDVLVRSTSDRQIVTALGGRPQPGDLLAVNGLAPVEADALLHFATSIPRVDTGTGSWEENDLIRTIGTANLLEAARRGGVRRAIGYSVVWVYGDHGDSWITEQTPLPARPRREIQSAVALEGSVRTAGMEWVILRGGRLYGPGTGTTEGMLAAAAAGALRTDGRGSAFESFVTAADTAQAAVLALDRIPSETVVNVVDDEPLRQRDFYRALASHVGGPMPQAGPEAPGWGSLRVSNALARSFGFNPRHPNVMAGLAALLPARGRPRQPSSARRSGSISAMSCTMPGAASP